MRYLYWRGLTRGGFVAVELVRDGDGDGEPFAGRVIVERRANAARRAPECARPVIALAESATLGGLFNALYPIASSNGVVAARLRAAAG